MDKSDLSPVVEEYSNIIDERANQFHAEGKVKSLYADSSFTQRLMYLASEAPEIAAGMDIMQARGKATFNFLKNPKF